MTKEQLRKDMLESAQRWIDDWKYEIEYSTDDSIGLIKRYARPRLDRHQRFQMYDDRVEVWNDDAPTTCERCGGPAEFLQSRDVILKNDITDMLHVCLGCVIEGDIPCLNAWSYRHNLGTRGYVVKDDTLAS